MIPAIAIPLSLIGGLFLMLLMGFTINLLTLLAMVLAIGIVVDDAIIVLENIHPVSYTHLDVYKRQDQRILQQHAATGGGHFGRIGQCTALER